MPQKYLLKPWLRLFLIFTVVKQLGLNPSQLKKDVFEGEMVWEGVVRVFDLIDHPKAKRCYAWSHELERSKKRRFFAVLHQGVVDSPQKAVRAAVVRDQSYHGIQGKII